MSKFKIDPLCTLLPIEQFIERFCKVFKDTDNNACQQNS